MTTNQKIVICNLLQNLDKLKKIYYLKYYYGESVCEDKETKKFNTEDEIKKIGIVSYDFNGNFAYIRFSEADFLITYNQLFDKLKKAIETREKEYQELEKEVKKYRDVYGAYINFQIMLNEVLPSINRY